MRSDLSAFCARGPGGVGYLIKASDTPDGPRPLVSHLLQTAAGRVRTRRYWRRRVQHCAQPHGRPVGGGRGNAAFGDGLRLRAEAPLHGNFKLIRDGKVVLSQTGSAFDYSVDKPGVYRVEVWLNLAGEDRPWILTNPIYVREKKKP